jgi:tetratricopeptide (TPR) repeat protein
MLRKENYSEALKSIDKAIQIRGNKIPLVYYTIRGKSYFGLHMADEAIRDHARVIDAGPDQFYNNNFLDSLYQRAILFSIKKEYSKSLADTTKLLEFVKPNSIFIFYQVPIIMVLIR